MIPFGLKDKFNPSTSQGIKAGRTRVPTWIVVMPDIACVALLLVFWVVYVGPVVVGEQRHGYDAFRDVGSAVNMQKGLFLVDPAYRGQDLWYPPLSPLIVAGTSLVLRVAPIDCYRWSGLLLNWLIPAGLFWTMRLQWGRRAAICGTVALLLAMPWWQREVHQGQASIHSAILGWGALALYAQQRKRRSSVWALACGVFQGICFWHHPIVPALLGASFLLQSLWEVLRAGKSGWLCGEVRRSLLTAAATLVVASPILYQMLHGPVLNHAGREYVAGELQSVEFALVQGNAWVWVMGLVGVRSCVRRGDWGGRVLVSYLAVALLGQAPGYLRLYGGEWAMRIPVVVPHEFQRFFQLGWAVAVGVGIDVALAGLATKFVRGRRFLLGLAALVACVITGGRGLAEAKDNYRQYLHRFPEDPVLREAGRWILENTNIEDVFACDPQLALTWLNAETGRRVWVMPEGHSNPRVDWHERAAVLAEMGSTSSPERFWQLAHAHGIDYIVPSPGWLPNVVADPNLYGQAVPAFLRQVYGGARTTAIFRVAAIPAGEVRNF